MKQIHGVFFNANKSFFTEIQKLYGIGSFRAKILCKILGINSTYKFKDIEIDQIYFIRNFLNKKFLYGEDLVDRENKNIKRLTTIRCFRGIRHKYSLPVRGQRSKTNAKTQKRKKTRNIHFSSKYKASTQKSQKKGKKKK